ncbi:MAG TPA: tape measure protein, partial [Thermoanaerobaculia bacterium]|nr:tape measure protein [Thermoanaerobaculia bacterium]
MATTRWVRIGIDPTAAKQGAKHVEASLSAIKKQAGGLQSSFSTLRGALSTFAAVGVGVVARSIAQATVQMQTMRSTLNLVGGSVEAGTKELAFLREEANRLGLSLVDSATAYGKFSYAARAGGLSAAETRKVFSSVMEASRAFGLSSDQASGALLAMEQMMSKGVVAAEELRGQLGERLPGAFTMAAKAMGMTTQELGKALQMGEVLAVDLLPKLADALRADLKEAAEEAAQGLQAQMARLSTAWFDFRAVISDSGVGEGFARLVGTLAEWLQWLASNWHAVMAAIYASFRDATEKLLGLINAAIDVQLRAVQGLYSMLEKLPSIIPGVEKQKTALEGLRAWFESAKGDFLLTYLESLAETFDEKYNAALDRAAEALKSTGEAASDVRPSVQGLGKDSEKAAKELAKLVEEALRLGASHNEVFRWQRELEDALGVMAKLEAAGLENSRAWNAVADAIVQIAKGLDEAQQAAYKLATVKMDDAWAGITSGEKHPLSQRNDEIGRGMLADFKRAHEEASRLAETLERQFSSTRENYEQRMKEIELAKAGGLSASAAAGAASAAWHSAADEMIGSIGAVFEQLSQTASGTFARIAGYIANLARSIQGANQMGAGVSDAMTKMGMGQYAGAAGGAATMFGVYMAIYQLGKQIVADQKARRYSDGGQVGVTRGHLDWYGGSTKYGGQFAEQMKDLIRSIEDTLGGSFQDLAKISIKVRNDGKDVQAFVDGILIGKFSSVDEAIKAAFGRALRSSKLTGLDDLVAQGISEVNYGNLDEALEKLSALREIAELDFSDGLTSLLESVRGFEKLWAVLQEMDNATDAVVAGFARIAAAEAQAWQAARDSITGRERT